MVDLSHIQSLDCKNIGDGLGLYVNNNGTVNEVLGFKTLIGGPGIVLNADETTITIEYVGMSNGGAIPFSKIVGTPASIAPLGLLYGTPDNRLEFVGAPTRPGSVLSFNGANFEWTDVPLGTLTEVKLTTSTPEVMTLCGPFQSSEIVSYEFGLNKSGVSPGTYGHPEITIDEFGRIVSARSLPVGSVIGGRSLGSGIPMFADAANGLLAFRSIVGQGGISVVNDAETIFLSSNAVTRVDAVGDDAISVSGAPITSSGTLKIAMKPTGVQPGTYSMPTMNIDELGRITAIASNTSPSVTARSLGGGAEVFANRTDQELRFRSIRTTGAVTATVDDETITLGCSSGVTRVDLQGENGITIIGSPITGAGVLGIRLSQTGVEPGTYSSPTLTVDTEGRITAISTPAPEEKVTISGSSVVNVVGSHEHFMVDLYRSPLRAGTYTVSKITTDDYGRVLAVEEAIPAAIKASESPVEPLLDDTGVVAGTYSSPRLTVDPKGRITEISQGETGMASELVPTGVAPGTYENPTLTIDEDGRVVRASSSSSSILPRNGMQGQVLTLVGGKPVWQTTPTKLIPTDLPEAQSWRLVVTALDGSGMMALHRIQFHSTVGGAPISVAGEVLCDDPGWGDYRPANAFTDQSGYVATANFNPTGLTTIGFHYESPVVVREFSVKAGLTGYQAPTKIELQYLMGGTWEKAWSVTSSAPWALGETRVFSIAGGPADEAFRTLSDTPDSYRAQALKHLRVKQDETGLEFIPMPRRSGGSHHRPDYHDGDDIGKMFFDTSLGQPIWWTGQTWVDAMGGSV